MTNYVCVHGHFYQPPRENPWLEAIELQVSAHPYHDWNERITAECYAPNGAARMLAADGSIERIVNNYSHISFNFGPTLLSWLEIHEPRVYRTILAADRQSMERFGGHGSAMAQAYNHIIMPLANERDRRTQVLWGIADFKRRFGRDPEGMWLPETAADTPSLEALAEQGIRFTVLAPRQAAAIRKIGGTKWENVDGERVDPTRPYLCNLPSGRSIALFFYDGPISRAVAFEGLLHKGEYLAGRLLGAIQENRTWPQIIHIATDGETFGHHHRYGEMALAYALESIDEKTPVKLINYGEYLELHPPTHEARIIENTSWSCVHGIERWRADCGCCSGANSDWNQRWRAPLRVALDWLRDELAPKFETALAKLLKDPWSARDQYIECVLDRHREHREEFLRRHQQRELNSDEKVKAIKLLEMQRQALLMYTSCGWFFDDLGGIETVQIVEYAARAIQLAKEALGQDLEGGFLDRYTLAESNLPSNGNGRNIWERLVRPAANDLLKVGAQCAIASLFESLPEEGEFYGYAVRNLQPTVYESGRARLSVGSLEVESMVTGESLPVEYGVIHLGDHNLSAGVRNRGGKQACDQMVSSLLEPFERADLPQAIRALDACFPDSVMTISTLFRDEQLKILSQVLSESMNEAEESFIRIHERNAPLMRLLAGLNLPLPRPFLTAGEFALNAQLRHALEAGQPDVVAIEALLREVTMQNVKLDEPILEFALRQSIERLAIKWERDPEDLEALRNLEEAVGLKALFPFELNNWKLQNIFHDMVSNVASRQAQQAQKGDAAATAWIEQFRKLGTQLRMGALIP